MKAIVQGRYGSADVLKLQEIDKPVVEDDEVLVRVRAASVHPDVWHVLTGLPYVLRIMGAGLRRPKNPVPGTDLAGIIESVGKNVTRFKPGDPVFAVTLWSNFGGYAEYKCLREDGMLALKPANLTYEDAAALGMHFANTASQFFPELLKIADPGPFYFLGQVPDEIAQAAAGMGLDAIFVEVHPTPERAPCDGPSQLSYQDFERLLTEVRAVDRAVARARPEKGAATR